MKKKYMFILHVQRTQIISLLYLMQLLIQLLPITSKDVDYTKLISVVVQRLYQEIVPG